MQDNYDRYDQWKGWAEDQFMVLGDFERAYYKMEFAGISLRGERVLEVGFGSGSLLAWLQEQGVICYGTEISAQGRDMAARRGVTMLDVDLAGAASLQGQFGVVAVFDVLEHLTHQQIFDLLDKAALLLRPGGHVIARFPNGGSPFGGIIQHSDMTHVTTLTKTKIGQLIVGKPFTIERAGDTAIPMHGGIAARVAKHGRRLLRRAFERGVSALYGYHDMSFYHNLTVVLRRLE